MIGPLKLWVGGAIQAAVNSLFDGSVLGGSGGALSLLVTSGKPMKFRLAWAGVHVALPIALHAWLDVRAWVKNGHSFPNIFDAGIQPAAIPNK